MKDLATYLSNQFSIDKSDVEQALQTFHQQVNEPSASYQHTSNLDSPLYVVSLGEVLQSIKKTKSSQVLLSKLLHSTKLTLKFLAESVFEMTPKTLAKYKNEHIQLPKRISEIAIKLLGLYDLGIEVFGSAEDFNTWSQKPSMGLDFNIPRDYFSTVSGIDCITEELQRIAFGYPV